MEILYAICMTLLVCLYSIGCFEGLVTPAISLRIILLILPAFMYRKNPQSTIGITACGLVMLGVKVVISYIVKSGSYTDPYMYYMFVSGCADMFIVPAYFIGTYIYIIDKTKEKCYSLERLKGFTKKNKIAVHNYMYISLIAVVSFAVSGVFVYDIDVFVPIAIVLSIGYFIVYNNFLSAYNKIFSKACRGY